MPCHEGPKREKILGNGTLAETWNGQPVVKSIADMRTTVCYLTLHNIYDSQVLQQGHLQANTICVK